MNDGIIDVFITISHFLIFINNSLKPYYNIFTYLFIYKQILILFKNNLNSPKIIQKCWWHNKIIMISRPLKWHLFHDILPQSSTFIPSYGMNLSYYKFIQYRWATFPLSSVTSFFNIPPQAFIVFAEAI